MTYENFKKRLNDRIFGADLDCKNFKLKNLAQILSYEK